ncbi:MAG: transposase [Bacteroidota bacterium]|nr:transposase [Bacteroidota bacterium]
MNEKKRYTSEQKVIILRELLEKNTPISQVAEKYNVHVNDIYNWKKKLFENAASVFETKSSAANTVQEKKIEKLEEKLKKNADAINWLVSQNIELKKNIDGEI